MWHGGGVCAPTEEVSNPGKRADFVLFDTEYCGAPDTYLRGNDIGGRGTATIRPEIYSVECWAHGSEGNECTMASAISY